MTFMDGFLKRAASSVHVPPNLNSEFRALADRPLGISRDEHGQPLARGYNESRRIDRAVNEMIGVLRGILAGGSVTPPAIIELAKWLLRNQEAATTWPVSVVVNEVGPILGTRRITEQDCEHLHSLFLKVTGPDAGVYECTATRLPLTDPAPRVIFDGHVFVFTGKFLYGSRRACRTAVVERGGTWADNPTRDTSYVVIGAIGSADWVYSIHGRKIEHALHLRESGHPLAIIAEDHWGKFLD